MNEMKNKNNDSLIAVLLLLMVLAASTVQGQQIKDRYRLMFYNVENLFDLEDDPKTADDEFTPTGTRSWNEYKLRSKLSNIFKVVAAVGEGNAPDIIMVCEIENRAVLEMILNQTPLRHHGYEIIHKDSRDSRGIDVGLFYKKERYWPLEEHFIAVPFSDKSGRVSRDILYTKGLILNSDTLHIFVNHWPSKFGGAMATRPMRDDVARALKIITDSILDSNPQANIIITGDLNTGPEDEPVKETLGAAMFPDTANSRLVNMTTAIYPSKYKGTIKFQGAWECIDQWIVSKPLVDKTSTLTKTSAELTYIGEYDFLLEEDKTHLGKMPFRTYIGFSFNGGFSDHLPTYMDLLLYE